MQCCSVAHGILDYDASLLVHTLVLLSMYMYVSLVIFARKVLQV
jgi:hypothetical protein